MPLDHPRHQGRAGKVDGAGVWRCRDIRAGGGDAVAFDEHGPTGVDRGAVEDLRRAEKEGFGCGGGRDDQRHESGEKAKGPKGRKPTRDRARSRTRGAAWLAGDEGRIVDGHCASGTQVRASRKDFCARRDCPSSRRDCPSIRERRCRAVGRYARPPQSFHHDRPLPSRLEDRIANSRCADPIDRRPSGGPVQGSNALLRSTSAIRPA